MVTLLEHEAKQGIMLRAMTGDIKKEFNDIMNKLYTNYTCDDYNDAAAEWAMIVADYFTGEAMRKYTILINQALQKQINLWTSDKWKYLMKIQLPIQYRKRMAEFTQVPKLGTMLTPIEKKERIDDW